jgi:hypothetical protein
MTEEILKRVDALAAKLGVAAGELWRILVTQAKLESYYSIVWAVLFTTVAALLGYVSYKLLRSAMLENYSDNGGPGVFAAFCAVAALCVGLGFTQSAFTGIYNPEYKALGLLRDALNTNK